MQDDLFSQLCRIVSPERLSSYCKTEGEDGNLVIATYLWNLALSESLYPSLQSLEIALRNSMNLAITAAFGDAWWFAESSSVLDQRDWAQVAESKSRLQRDGKPVEAGRVVAELSFGFWTSLLDRRYEQVFWPQLLKSVFPHMPRRIRTRKEAGRRLNQLRRLRNRVFHYQPIWHWKDLVDQHTLIIEFIGWIDPTLRDITVPVDRFVDIHGRGVAPYHELVARIAREQ